MQGGDAGCRGSVDRSRVRHVAQHELDTAARLAKFGFRVVLREADVESTADAYVNDVLADFKWSSSSRTGNIQTQVKKRRDNQGPRFIVDISSSSLAIDEVAPAMQRLCDQYPDRIVTIMVVDRMAMRVVGEEVPQWRL
ncbi:hypothetical protein ACAG26_18745 [Mycobacterium sp. pUA109]|uniref:CdiA C-terminal domain-containing protein n=1 Tax=Mycobacterium sp. pUA109 TaxID=3238982 RepID=UPI00351AC03F